MNRETFADKDELRRILENTFDEDHPEDVIRVIATFAHMARCEGLLSLESYASEPKSPEFQVLLRLLVNGTEPAVIQEVSRNLAKAGLQRREAFLEILSQGTNALNQGCSPRVVFELLYSILGKSAPEGLTMDPGGTQEVLSSEERDALYEAISPDLRSEETVCQTFSVMIPHLSDRDLQTALRGTDLRELALALKSCPREVLRKVIENMSIRAAIMLQEDINCMGPARPEAVIEAQEYIVGTIRKLAEAGDIVLPHAPEKI